MGLDQYLYTREVKEDEKARIAYWRKHNRLQGYMQELWEAKGNTDEMNCKELYLSKKDIENVLEHIEDKSLPFTEGFFYGSDSYEYEGQDEMLEYDIASFKIALSELEEGNTVFYSCWY